MASVTIRKLDAGLEARLRVRAARYGRSMEEEARHILQAALAEDEGAAPRDLARRSGGASPRSAMSICRPRRGSRRASRRPRRKGPAAGGRHPDSGGS